MEDKLIFLVRQSLLRRSRLLTISPEYISISRTDEEDAEESLMERTTILKDELDAYRYTSMKVRYYAYLYVYYKIDIRGINGQAIKVRMLSLFGLGKKRVGRTYARIVNALYNYYFKDLAKYYLQLFINKIDFDISGIIFTQKGVQFSAQSEIVRWEDIETADYVSYYAISSKHDKYNYRGVNYWDDWNTPIIYSVTRTILRDKGLLLTL